MLHHLTVILLIAFSTPYKMLFVLPSVVAHCIRKLVRGHSFTLQYVQSMVQGQEFEVGFAMRHVNQLIK